MLILDKIYASLKVPALISAAKIQLLDLSPEEAQKLITQQVSFIDLSSIYCANNIKDRSLNSQSLDLRYATKLSEGPASGRSYNGKIIDSNDFTEEIYDANQFHGQDGLGRAIFGYTDNQQSRLEARNANGEVRGDFFVFFKKSISFVN